MSQRQFNHACIAPWSEQELLGLECDYAVCQICGTLTDDFTVCEHSVIYCDGCLRLEFCPVIEDLERRRKS
jgi:hypothetical protein